MRVVVVVALLLLLLLAACDDGAAPVPHPDPDPGYSLWLHRSEVKPGDDVALFLVNHGHGANETFGVAATIDRWTGSRWDPHRFVATCLPGWSRCEGRPQDLDNDHVVVLIGLGAQPGSSGSLERFNTEGLVPGTYRIRKRGNGGAEAFGVFEVSFMAGDDAAPLDRPDVDGLRAEPRLVLPDQPHAVAIGVQLARDSYTIHDEAAAAADRAEEVELERWVEGRWKARSTLPLRPDDSGHPAMRALDLPPLVPGEYRLVWRGGDAALVGRLWVADFLDAPSAPDRT